MIDFVVLMEKLVRYQDVDWQEVKAKRESGEKFNWCPIEKLSVLSAELRNLGGGYFFGARMRRTEVRPISS